MRARSAPILASEATAAALLDMPVGQFRQLVRDGVLPRARDLGGLARWDTDELRRIGAGEAADGLGDVAW